MEKIDLWKFMRHFVLVLSLFSVHAQFGQRNLHEEPSGAPMNDVDLAMAGWAQLSQNPDKMQELWKSFKDPEVMAKAQEMLSDPVYMAAAKKKVCSRLRSWRTLSLHHGPKHENCYFLHLQSQHL